MSLVVGSPALGQTNTLSAREKAGGWRLLFDGRSLEGWTPEGGAKWRVSDGVIVGDDGDDGWLRHDETITNFHLRCEFRNIPKGNSGILRASQEGRP